MFKELVALITGHNRIDPNITTKAHLYVVTNWNGTCYQTTADTAEDAMITVCTYYRLDAAKCKVKQFD